MGMFDSVWIRCRECGEEVEFQSKAGPCQLRDYRQETVPTEIAKDILGSVRKCSCGNVIIAKIAPNSIDNVAMVGE